MSKEEKEALFGVTSERGESIEVLEEWLTKEYWNFGGGRFSFDGHSEGNCVLAGIDPMLSMETESEYGPYFLPGTLQQFCLEDLGPKEEGLLRKFFDDHIDDLKSLGLKGRVHCHVAIARAVELGLSPPWLQAAQQDAKCQILLPKPLCDEAVSVSDSKLRTRSSIAAAENARVRWELDDDKKLRQGVGRDAFDKLRKLDFEGCRTANGKIQNSKIARKIQQCLSEFSGGETQIPERTLALDVKNWRQEIEADES